MKEKTSITLSREVLTGIDRMSGSKRSRSAFIESVLRQYLKEQVRAQIEARDLEALNRAAKELAPEIDEVLEDQSDLGEMS
jgi:Arc/MetJ-type ribon-helix-helix transcriptional regulator